MDQSQRQKDQYITLLERQLEEKDRMLHQQVEQINNMNASLNHSLNQSMAWQQNLSMNLSNISNLSHFSNVSKNIAGKANDLSLLNVSGFKPKATDQEEEEKDLCKGFEKAQCETI